MTDIVLSIVDFEDGFTRENVEELFNFDADFTMENGYLLTDASQRGYETNFLDYLFDMVKTSITPVQDAVNIFMKMYGNYWVNCDLVINGTVVTLAVVSEG